LKALPQCGQLISCIHITPNNRIALALSGPSTFIG
jgi:hypothetical protein